MSKYLNRKTEADGIMFDSRKEARYYLTLKRLQENGKISNLRRQVRYELVPAVYREETVHLKTKDKTVRRLVQRAIHYIADFVYTDTESGNTIVCDVKGGQHTITKEFILKKKMMKAFKDIDIVIV